MLRVLSVLRELRVLSVLEYVEGAEGVDSVECRTVHVATRPPFAGAALEVALPQYHDKTTHHN